MVYGPPTAKEIWAALFARERTLQKLTGDPSVTTATATATAPKSILEESKYKDVAFVREGKKIIIPPDMSWDEIAFWAARRKTEDERVVAIYEELPYSPMDGAVAFHRALADIYGWVDLVPSGFWQDPPAMIGVMIGPDERIQVPWGNMKVQGIEGVLGTSMQEKPIPRFLIHGEVKHKSLPQVSAIVARTFKFLKEQSIYKGKAVKISYEWQRQGIRFDAAIHCPQFMRLNGVSEDDLIFGKEVQTALEIGLFTPIAYADAMRKFKVPLKRGILLHGPFGCGKTLTSNITAIKAVRAGFTFIYLDNVLDLKKGLEFAAQYGPSVLFAEDIDRAITGERTTSMDEILNCLDGIDSKGSECITVLTTNNLDAINPAMLRMGRLDTLVEIKPPDEKAAVRLIQHYGRGLLSSKTDYDKLGAVLKDKIPAYIREVLERGKIAAILRLQGQDITGKVEQEDLLHAATAMENHYALLTPKKKVGSFNPEMFVRIPKSYSDSIPAILESLGLEDQVPVGSNGQ